MLDPDPLVRAAATEAALTSVTHQNSVYEATVPVALYAAAILHHPVIASSAVGIEAGAPSHRPSLVRLLEWLGDTARDADDVCLAHAERHCDPRFPEADREMHAFRALRPAIFSAVRPHLRHDDSEVRELALIAAIPLAEHPSLAGHRDELAEQAVLLLSTCAERRRRDQVLGALAVWGHDTYAVENAEDIAARELRARRAAERARWTGGYSAEPPF
ncbi:hypothetical protein ACGFYZ_31135 [Streptomyces sp. NPDC048330]|uniref:hypothetical protein n=1 Tax=Streptomyces sp. NPDC048330 TaxID=3365533 RepID=UPI0037124262